MNCPNCSEITLPKEIAWIPTFTVTILQLVCISIIILTMVVFYLNYKETRNEKVKT